MRPLVLLIYLPRTTYGNHDDEEYLHYISNYCTLRYVTPWTDKCIAIMSLNSKTRGQNNILANNKCVNDFLYK